MKLSTSGGLAVADYFEMDNQSSENGSDTDLGSGGAMVLPDLSDGAGHTMHLAVGAGKDSNLYVVNRDYMGKVQLQQQQRIYQELAGAVARRRLGHARLLQQHGLLRIGGQTRFRPSPSRTRSCRPAPPHTPPTAFGYPGATPSISANGTSNGIVWAIENSSPAVLHAYDATTLNELYNSNQAAGGRDHFGNGNKFITPTIVNGKVFVGTPNGVAVFGLLP